MDSVENVFETSTDVKPNNRSITSHVTATRKETHHVYHHNDVAIRDESDQ
jgi:hypothetical protein